MPTGTSDTPSNPRGRDLKVMRVWILEAGQEGFSLSDHGDDRFSLHAWVERRDDLWAWEANISAGELAAVVADPTRAPMLMRAERAWKVFPPPSRNRPAYEKCGRLAAEDGLLAADGD